MEEEQLSEYGIAVRTSPGIPLLPFAPCLATGWVPLQKCRRRKRNQGMVYLRFSRAKEVAGRDGLRLSTQ